MCYINFQNKKIFYRAGGKGRCVVLLHGFGEDHRVWKYQLDKLQERFFVIAPDIPGSGKSEMLETATIEDYAESVKAIIDFEISENKRNPFTLIGHSMGGYIALAFAEKYTELLNAFGLFHSSAYGDDELKKETRRKGINFIKKNGAHAFLKTSIPNLFCEKTKEENPELAENLIALTKDFSSEAMIQYYDVMIKRPDRTTVLKSFVKPILFIAGKNDSAVPLEVSLKQCYLPAISHLHIMQNSGHMGMWEEQEKANNILYSFLD